MRETEASGWKVRAPWQRLARGLWLSSVAFGIGLVMVTGPVRAADLKTRTTRTFEEKIIEGIMAGIGGTNMENRGIDYRERSPLVVPPKLDLPPPAADKAEVKAQTGRRTPTSSAARQRSRRGRR